LLQKAQLNAKPFIFAEDAFIFLLELSIVASDFRDLTGVLESLLNELSVGFLQTLVLLLQILD
jgi:hypothetical protein